MYLFGRTVSSCVVHDGLVYAADLGGYLHCLDARTGTPYWSHDLRSTSYGSPCWVDGKVYIGTEDGDVWIFSHGKEKRKPRVVEMGSGIYSSPVFANGVLYIAVNNTLFAIAEK